MNADSYDLAYAAALGGALALYGVASGLNLPDPAGAGLRADARLIATVLAPGIIVAADVAAIGLILGNDAILAGQAVLQPPPAIPNPAADPMQAAMRLATTPLDAAPVFYAAAAQMQSVLPPLASPGRGRAAQLARGLAAAAEAGFLGQAFLMETQSQFADRQSAIAARQRISDALDAAADRIAAAIGGTVWDILAGAGREAIAWLASIAGDLKPIVRVSAGRSFPSTALAYALYGDPTQAADLVARNLCGTPLFMPAEFEALSPTAN